MQLASWQAVVAELTAAGVPFDEGLTDEEVQGVETRYGFRFPPDLREFLQVAMPLGKSFPNWRVHDETAMREWLDLPLEGILFDVEFNDFWMEEWGAPPDELGEAMRTARRLIAAAPILIPVYAHRMMPDDPSKAGNPVFSVHQTDIIHYAHDLLGYLRHEFGVAKWWTPPAEARLIRFWDIERFLTVRWSKGSCIFDNRRGDLPK